MQSTWRATLVAGALAMGSMLVMGAISARAQAVGGTARGASPGYDYSLGGYNGGTYFNPDYHASPGTAGGRVGTGFNYGSSSAGSRARSSTNYYDPTTGRNNLAMTLAKPWLRPLR
jgi:hypothetical protein